MKIAIVDMIYTKGHKNYNSKVIDILSVNNQVIFFDSKFKYYGNMSIKPVFIDGLVDNPSGRIKGRIQMYKNTKIQLNALKNEAVDYIFVLNFDAVVMRYMFKKLQKIAKVGVIHHNLNYFDSFFKYKFFSKFKNKVDNYVLDDFLINPLVDKYCVNAERVKVFLHPITLKFNISNKSNYISLLSGSTSDDMVVDLYNKREKLSLKDYELFVKNRSINYSQKNVVFCNSYLTADEYNNILNKTKVALFMFPSDFVYHVSGVVIDNLANDVIIISNSTPFIEYLKKKYPKIIYIYENIDGLIELLNNIDKVILDVDYSQFLQFKMDRDDKIIGGVVQNVIEE